ncbi:MAG: phosphatidic acid phosphatase, partial [Cyclobacteriaceae bacterium]
MRKLIIFLVGVITLGCSSDEQYRENIAEFKNPELFNTSMKKLSDIIVHDIFSPPVASRIYAYPSIAAYEALIHDYPDYVSLSGQLTDFTLPPKPEQGVEYSFPLASFHAFHIVGKALIFSEEKMEAYQESFYQDFLDKGM